ncbi:hypothetical protein DAEQUDRAFT_733122 [Daedalea quercina L-15889]|uniref:Uncharacterized protein n=1 Tax=Daedalea quercina L-15889 TaxID=1314783 RepID=A0A165L7W2_9APHY|nr:hypothetical protein DAEQUDRAFT_733122 [Daedalea quercina L-15889]
MILSLSGSSSCLASHMLLRAIVVPSHPNCPPTRRLSTRFVPHDGGRHAMVWTRSGVSTFVRPSPRHPPSPTTQLFWRGSSIWWRILTTRVPE